MLESYERVKNFRLKKKGFYKREKELRGVMISNFENGTFDETFGRFKRE